MTSTQLCNHSDDSTNMSASSGQIRAYKIDVTSMPSPSTITQIGYDGGDDMVGGGSLVLGLYTDNSGTPQTLLCQTDPVTAATGTHMIDTTTTPSVSHSNTLWIAMITTGTVDYPAGQEVASMQKQQVYTGYPTFPTTMVPTSTNNNWIRGCVVYTDTPPPPASSTTLLPPPPAMVRL